MTRISCSLSYTTSYNAEGFEVQCVSVECSRCNHSETAYGESEASVKRCLANMRENCPRNENNYYEVVDR